MNKLTQELLAAIPEDTHIGDLAEAIATIVETEYGDHNKRQFIETILLRLGEEISAKIAMQALRDKGYYASNLWHIDDVNNTIK
jgi:hypothetical protein